MKLTEIQDVWLYELLELMAFSQAEIPRVRAAIVGTAAARQLAYLPDVFPVAFLPLAWVMARRTALASLPKPRTSLPARLFAAGLSKLFALRLSLAKWLPSRSASFPIDP